jgi:hypothetical protein
MPAKSDFSAEVGDVGRGFVEESPWTALTATKAPATSTATATTTATRTVRDLRFTGPR